MTAVERYNALDGKTTAREELQEILALAENQGQNTITKRIQAVLDKHEDLEFFVTVGRTAIDTVPDYCLPGLEFIECKEEFNGLEKAVSPDDIYQYITDLMLNTIKEVGDLPWQREWEKTSLYNGYQALNFESKKGYRGINYFLLNFEVKVIDGERILVPADLTNPFFLTFNQIEKNKGKLNKGATGKRVVYFTKLYSHEEEQPDGTILSFGSYSQSKFRAWITKNQHKLQILKRSGWTIDRLANSYIPILKYYNVFHAEDITGIDWGIIPKNENSGKPEKQRIEIAEKIIELYPKKPKIIFKGDQPAYYPSLDQILMTPIEAFKNEESFYSTLFHECIHSTGHSKRLDRGNDTRARDNSIADKKAYAFEELVAEMGAVFLCAESGILFSTKNNSAKYMRGWNSRLAQQMEGDNRFFFRAASRSQAGADLMLDRNKAGIPAYQNSIAEATSKITLLAKETKNKVLPKKIKPPVARKPKSKQLKMALAAPWHKGIAKTALSDCGRLKKGYMYTKGGKIEKVGKKQPTKKIVKKKTTAELEKANPKGFSIKPKSIAIATAVKNILSLDKFKDVNAPQATLLHKYFKDFEDLKYDGYGFSKKFFGINSGFEEGILFKESKFYDVVNNNLSITEIGFELVKAIKNRIESLHNQKNNLALFDGLKGPIKKEDPAWFPKYSKFKNKPKQAIQHLLKVKKGDCLKALYRKDVGFIDIVWGENDSKTNKGFGLKHIIEKHGKEIEQLGFKIEDFIPIVVQFGTFKISTTKNRIELSGEMFKIIISKEENKTFVLSAFDVRPLSKRRKLKGLNGSIDGINFNDYPLHSQTSNFLLKNKDTKKTKLPKKGLKSPVEVLPVPVPVPIPIAIATVQPEVTTPAALEPKKERGIVIKTEPTRAKNLATAMLNTTQNEVFNIPGDIGLFLGQVEKKPVHSVVTTIDAEQGAGKTRLVFQIMNALAGMGIKCLFYSLEEHPQSKLFKDKVIQYIDPSNLTNISVIDEVLNWDDEKATIEAHGAIFFDSFQKLPKIDLDRDIRKAFNGKLFYVIYQQTGTKTMRGGSEAAFDGDQILKVKKHENYKENYAFANKNRYQDDPDIKFNIYKGALVREELPGVEEFMNSRRPPDDTGGRLIATPMF